MGDKTTVTNASVSESEGKQSQNTQSGEGQSPSEKEIENRVRENLRVEYSRKNEELSEKLSEAESRLQELEEKADLSSVERKELGSLQEDKGEIEEEIRLLETDKKYRPYVLKIERESEKAKNEAVNMARFEMSLDQMKIYIADKAESEDISYEEMYKEINKNLEGKYVKDLLPAERARIGFQERSKMKSLEKRESELKERESKLDNFSESGQRQAREPNLSEAIKSGDTIAQAKALGL